VKYGSAINTGTSDISEPFQSVIDVIVVTDINVSK